MQPTVRINPPGIGAWGILGVDYGNGIVPQGLTLTSNEAGPDTASFSLRRDAKLPWADLLPYADVEVEVPGSGVVWSGRIWDVTYPNTSEIQVSCRGWQYLLDDDMLRDWWVRNGWGGFVDARTIPDAGTGWLQDPAPSFGQTLTLQFNPIALTAGQVTGVSVDVGSASITAVDVDYVGLSGSANVAFYIRGATDSLALTGTSDAYSNTTSLMSASATVGGTLAAAKQYLLIFLYVGTGFTPTTPVSIQLTGVRLYANNSYRSGSASILKASDVVTDVLSTYLTELDTSTTRITATSTNIPHLSTDDLGGNGYASPRQVFQAVNAWHDYLLGVDERKRVFFEARPTAPLVEIGEWTGAEFSDAGDSGEELYNRVLVAYTGPDGKPSTEDRSSTSPLLGLGSYTRSRVLSISSPLTASAAQTIGDTWLASRVRRPTRGSVAVTGHGGARYITSGSPVAPADLLRLTGQMLRLANRWNPDDGGWGRDGYITSVTYNADTDSASVTLDSPKDRLDVFLGRLAAVRNAGLPLA